MAHITDLGFTLSALGRAVDDGRVRTQTHPEFPTLTIANYTEDVQYRNSWDNITLTCRGLIFDSVTGEVIARPWKKFFNLGQRENEIDSDAPVEVTDKMDGSLGILYQRPDGLWAIATRGSFNSDQALHATELFNDRYQSVLEKHTSINGNSEFAGWVKSWTYLFEIVYPENRIVVDYGDMDDLVLLGSVHKRHGYYEGPRLSAVCMAWDGPVTETWQYKSFVEAVSFPDREGMEGVVIRSGKKMVKLKQQDYIELHRIVTNLSPKAIWEMLAAGRTVRSICADIPDEFHKYVSDIADDIYTDYAGIKLVAYINFARAKEEAFASADADGNVSRKAWAEAIKSKEHSGLLFMLLDNRPIDDVVWKMVKPRGDAKEVISRGG